MCIIDVSLLSIVVDCGALSDPANGQVTTTETTFGQNATYSCNTGYNLMGDSTRTCQATENWSGSTPTCQSMLLFSSASHIIIIAKHNTRVVTKYTMKKTSHKWLVRFLFPFLFPISISSFTRSNHADTRLVYSPGHPFLRGTGHEAISHWCCLLGFRMGS